jgi:Fe-S-cluster-containing dehydrogenase component
LEKEKTITRSPLSTGALVLGATAIALGTQVVTGLTTAFAEEAEPGADITETPVGAETPAGPEAGEAVQISPAATEQIAETSLRVAAQAASPVGTDDLYMCFFFKARLCTNCGACVDACRKYNNTPEDKPARRKLEMYTLASGEEVPITTSCMHCENPSCVSVCPAGAIEKRLDGIVALHVQRCIGCKYCYSACPFGVPQYNEESMDKCDFCIGNGVEPGTKPRCAQACPTKALEAGRLRDLHTRLIDDVKTYQQLESSTGAQFYLA